MIEKILEYENNLCRRIKANEDLTSILNRHRHCTFFESLALYLEGVTMNAV
jgi:hypothetical protein